MPQSSQNPERDAYIAGLRELADWLEQHPDVAFPRYSREISIPLHANPQVEEFARAAGLDVVTDEAGNFSASVTFGAVAYRAYGYADWDQHLAQYHEKQARTWAERNDMVIQPRDVEGGAR